MSESRWFTVIPPSGAARIVAQHISNNLIEKLGKNRVKLFDSLIYNNSFKALLKKTDETLVVDLINQSIIISCLDFETTHFFSGALSPVTLFSLNLLKKQHIKTIHWFYEDYNRVPYWRSILTGYNKFFTIQKGPFPEICSKNQVDWHLLPTAASVPQADCLHDERRVFDIAFVGIPSSYRINVLEHIANNGYKCVVAGLGWENYSGPLQNSIISNKWIDENQLSLILGQTKIGLNLSFNDPEGISDVHISPRAFDILGSGATLLTEETLLNHEILHDFQFETFANPSQILASINTILSGFTVNDITRLQNMQIVKSHHTYGKRAEQILKLTE